MKKRTALLLILPCLVIANAYSIDNEPQSSPDTYSTSQRVIPFQHLEVALTGGSAGIGIDFSTSINNYLQIRGGFSFMPKFTLAMKFGVGIEENEGTITDENRSLAEENDNPTESKFDKMAALVEGLTGSKVNDEVTMLAEPNIYNFKFLLDVHPFQNKRWHFTTGFYVGSSTIGRAYNSAEDMPTLYAANMFNNMYDKALADEPVITWGNFDLYAPEDLLEYGRMGFAVGKKADGSVYKMEPNEYCMVGVDAKVNTFKPYLGFGYGTSALSGARKTNFSFDCGVLFWGGAPDLITHDGTNLTKDITNIDGKIGQYVDIARKFRVYPVVSISISRLLF